MKETTTEVVVIRNDRIIPEPSEDNILRIIVAGGREFNDASLVKAVLDKELLNQEKAEIVSGGARGADRLGEGYAKDNNIPIKLFPADWNKYGKKAGYIRNQQMANYANMLIAFWDGESRGTKHMIDIACNKKIRVVVITY